MRLLEYRLKHSQRGGLYKVLRRTRNLPYVLSLNSANIEPFDTFPMDDLLDLPHSLREPDEGDGVFSHWTAEQKLGGLAIALAVFSVLYPDVALAFFNFLIIALPIAFPLLLVQQIVLDFWAWRTGVDFRPEEEKRLADVRRAFRRQEMGLVHWRDA